MDAANQFTIILVIYVDKFMIVMFSISMMGYYGLLLGRDCNVFHCHDGLLWATPWA